MKLDFQVGFTWFAEWWRTEQRIKDDKERAKYQYEPQLATLTARSDAARLPRPIGSAPIRL